MLYELVTARRLFKGDNDYLTMAMIVEGDVPPPSSLRPELPAALDEIIMRALAKSPEARYQTAYDLRSALESFAAEHELRTSAKSVADYLASVFGHRPEPWHEPGGVASVDDGDVDFDASPHGAVPTPSHGVQRIEQTAVGAGAPISLARDVARGHAPAPGTADFDEHPTRIDVEPDQEETATLQSDGSPRPRDADPDADDSGTRTLTGTGTGKPADASTTTAAPPIAAPPIADLPAGPPPAPRRAAMVATPPTATAVASHPPAPRAPPSVLRAPPAGAPPAGAPPAAGPHRQAPSAGAPPPGALGGAPTSPGSGPVRRNGDASGRRLPAAPILPASPPPLPVARAEADADAADEATTVEPPLFPFAEPVFDAQPPEAVYVPPPLPPVRPLPPLQRWGLVGAVLLIPIVIGLFARACRDDRAAGGPPPAALTGGP